MPQVKWHGMEKFMKLQNMINIISSLLTGGWIGVFSVLGYCNIYKILQEYQLSYGMVWILPMALIAMGGCILLLFPMRKSFKNLLQMCSAGIMVSGYFYYYAITNFPSIIQLDLQFLTWCMIPAIPKITSKIILYLIRRQQKK